MALRICAVASTKAPFAISDGWNFIPKIPTQRAAPFVLCPANSTHISINTDMISKKGVTILKYLHLMFSVTTMQKMPMSKMPMCFSTGDR